MRFNEKCAICDIKIIFTTMPRRRLFLISAPIQGIEVEYLNCRYLYHGILILQKFVNCLEINLMIRISYLSDDSTKKKIRDSEQTFAMQGKKYERNFVKFNTTKLHNLA